MSRGSHSILVEKSSLALKCQILKVTLPHFSTISLCKMSIKEVTSTFKFWHFKASEYFPTKIKLEPPDINAYEWPKVDECCYPPSIINSHFKHGIYVLSLYWGMNTFVHHCIKIFMTNEIWVHRFNIFSHLHY